MQHVPKLIKCNENQLLGPVHTEFLEIALALVMQKMGGKWQVLAKNFAKEWVENLFLAMNGLNLYGLRMGSIVWWNVVNTGNRV